MEDFYFILHSIAESIIIVSGFIIMVAFIIWALYLHAENEERNKKRQENSSLLLTKYCPHCGAKMDLKQIEEQRSKLQKAVDESIFCEKENS